MTEYSEAAKAYASQWWQVDTIVWHEVARTYDAAASSEPVRLHPPFGYVESIGVGCFASTETPEDDTVINWLGRNFTPQEPDANVIANLVCELVEIDDSREWTTVEARRLLAVARADS